MYGRSFWDHERPTTSSRITLMAAIFAPSLVV
jgi:hypothetical protein